VKLNVKKFWKILFFYSLILPTLKICSIILFYFEGKVKVKYCIDSVYHRKQHYGIKIKTSVQIV